MTNGTYALPTVNPFDDICPWEPLIRAAVEAHLLRPDVWEFDETDAAFDAVSDLITYLALNERCDMDVIGRVAFFVIDQPVSGWIATGQTVSGTDYPELFNVVPEAWKSGLSIIIPSFDGRPIVGAGVVANGATGYIQEQTQGTALAVAAAAQGSAEIPVVALNAFIYAGRD